MMKRLDDGVSAAASCFGRQTGQKSSRQSAYRGENQQDPRPKHVNGFPGGEGFAVGPQGGVPAQIFEQESLQVFKATEKESPGQAGGCSHQRGVEERLSDDAQIQRGAFRKDDWQEIAAAAGPPRTEPCQQAGPGRTHVTGQRMVILLKRTVAEFNWCSNGMPS
ncbi:MAG TPA: hypothetical protein VGL59_06170 [Polyangia bacterium]